MNKPLHRRGNTDPQKRSTIPIPIAIYNQRQDQHQNQNQNSRNKMMITTSTSPTSPSSSRLKSQTPLPFSQIAVLMGVRLAEPIIFPFVNQMVEELGVTDNPDRVGFYSGLVESVFAFVQFFTVYHWAKMSDKVGRKPVILFGLIGVVISGSLFGLATSFWMMIFFRCLSGALNGNVAVVRAAIGDVTDSTNSTEAFAMYGLTWTVGAIIGNALGGGLSHPYERFPSWFGSFEIFRIHPYLLPCLVTAGGTLIGIIFCLVFYQESLPSISHSNNSSRRPLSFPLLSFKSFKGHKRHFSSSSLVSEAETLVDGNNDDSSRDILSKLPRGEDGPEPEYHHSIGSGQGKQGPEWGFWRLMEIRKVRVMAATGFLNAFVQGAWGAASLLFFFDRNNGLSMSASAIGTAFAINGLWTILCQIILLNRIRRWLGISLGYKVLTIGWIFVWLLLPTLRTILLATEDPLPSPNPSTQFGSNDKLQFGETRGWIISISVNLYLSFVTIVNMTGSLLMVLINTSAPDKAALGAINGIATAVGCMARVIGPSLISALFAYSMDTNLLGGRAWWIFMILMSLVNLVVSFLVDKDEVDVAYSTSTDEVSMSLLQDREDDEESTTSVEGGRRELPI
ncbi:uncharacterized protein IL334_004158 [Kwoniella shivajii]|uniref:Major facilitator superfamily (MFS) profile domain-containing protein n=1 Tax=Kwoniella shivajii TaxID=564305 RepID=A0ABZ1CZJ5_9TREE|nr:hypothetical protein IL334_004158 [Kwoniella shivajii]